MNLRGTVVAQPAQPVGREMNRTLKRVRRVSGQTTLPSVAKLWSPHILSGEHVIRMQVLPIVRDRWSGRAAFRAASWPA